MADHLQQTKPSSSPETASALRRDIDRGLTGDKIAHPDPAAAPLGVDDEAAGMTPTAAEVATARAYETTRDAPKSRPDKTGPWVWAIIIVCIAVVGVAIAAVSWSG